MVHYGCDLRWLQLLPIVLSINELIDMGAMACLDRRCSIGRHFRQICRSIFGWTSTQLLSVGLLIHELIDVSATT
eukprot:COSAG02_NODE_62905_length_264_cov_1.248485_1_plen_74_part_01